MKKSLISATAIALALAAGSAFAADLPSRKAAPVYAPPPPPPPMWTGLYAGLNIGGGWGADSGNWGQTWDGGFTNHINGSGVIGGGQIGYNFAFTPLFLVGVETDFQGTSMGNNGQGGVRVDWFGTVRGRVGVTLMPTLLIYGTGGFAYGDVTRKWTGFTTTQTGWTAGGGVEWMALPNWSVKVEYLYTDISGGNQNWNWWNAGFALNNVNNHTRWNTIRAGVNYHFNFGGGGIAPVLAKY